jgi:uncharacterized protein YyaL (SSP411 family)
MNLNQKHGLESSSQSSDFSNRLINEPSPYLRQHANNPVDWYPWGQAAFELAQREDKPIFLSIGYSTCHWCHVMAHESFEDEAVARLLNATFVCIKVDREERPDIDQIYMTACQVMSGSGGWPLSIMMTPNKEPFLAATYIPRDSRFGRIGLMDLIPRIQQIWENDRSHLAGSAAEITRLLRAARQPWSQAVPLDRQVITTAYQRLQQIFDPEYGGFGPAPKFPIAHTLRFLLHHGQSTGQAEAIAMAEETLTRMRQGGLYDHVGFGFHRYSTDREWRLPHFEKMLYDQALLLDAYLDAYLATGKSEYAQTAREIVTYLRRDMTDPLGGCYSAEDADSEGVEGKFYLWTLAEIRASLTAEEAELVAALFQLQDQGNVVAEVSGHMPERINILAQAASWDSLARQFNQPVAVVMARWEASRTKLFAVRRLRPHPAKDDKILTDWNGLAMAAMARAGHLLNDADILTAAQKIGAFVTTHLCTPAGRLLHRYHQGNAAIPGYLDDYAFVIMGLLALYEATLRADYLEQAIRLTQTMIHSFWDETAGGFFFTAADGEELLVRSKESFDGALPSGNSMALCDLVTLARLTGDCDFLAKANQMMVSFAGAVRQAETGHTQFLIGLQAWFDRG